MSIIWAGAVEIALAWAVILGVKIASNAFEWKFEHLLPNYWYPVVKRKLEKPETATLKDKGIPKKYPMNWKACWHLCKAAVCKIAEFGWIVLFRIR